MIKNQIKEVHWPFTHPTQLKSTTKGVSHTKENWDLWVQRYPHDISRLALQFTSINQSLFFMKIKISLTTKKERKRKKEASKGEGQNTIKFTYKNQ